MTFLWNDSHSCFKTRIHHHTSTSHPLLSPQIPVAAQTNLSLLFLLAGSPWPARASLESQTSKPLQGPSPRRDGSRPLPQPCCSKCGSGANGVLWTSCLTHCTQICTRLSYRAPSMISLLLLRSRNFPSRKMPLQGQFHCPQHFPGTPHLNGFPGSTPGQGINGVTRQASTQVPPLPSSYPILSVVLKDHRTISHISWAVRSISCCLTPIGFTAR